jgi:hypothetical protein
MSSPSSRLLAVMKRTCRIFPTVCTCETAEKAVLGPKSRVTKLGTFDVLYVTTMPFSGWHFKKKRQKKLPTGPGPERVKLARDWKIDVKTALAKKRPEGWPKE